MKIAVELLQDNRLVGTHVHAKGDVVEMEQPKAKAWIKLGHAAITQKPHTRVAPGAPRFPENNFPVTRTASDPAAAAALKEAEERAKPKGKK